MAILGIKFPFQRSETGFPAPATDGECVEGNIERIIVTNPGSRVMRPFEGMGAGRMVFEASGPVLAAWVDFELRRKVESSEPRARVTRVTMTEETVDGRDVDIVDVEYEFLGRPAGTQVVP